MRATYTAKNYGLTLDLPYPPTGNLYWRHWRNRVVRSPEATKYKQGVKLRALTVGARPMSGPLCVYVSLFRPARRGDLDNSLKVLFDSLNGIAWEDDSQIEEIHAKRMEDKANPRAIVRVEPVAGVLVPVTDRIVWAPACGPDCDDPSCRQHFKR